MSVNDGNIRVQENIEYSKSPLTIERRLHLYESHPDKSARSAVLWHAWNQNKAWLSRLLELTLASFPSYSRHDASHAEAVLHNIERILGEKRIAELSATDCFAILHTVYVHDIGMSILASDRQNIVRSDGFIEMIDELAEGADSDLKKAAQQLKKNQYLEPVGFDGDYDGISYHTRKGKLYEEKLSTYYAVVYLVAEYQRKYHGEKVVSSIRDWISQPQRLGSEFAMSGIPMRIFLRIADCAGLHTDWEFGHVMELPHEENGYEMDMLHPRFVAVMLQLGDALDIDNDRFHPFAEEFLGGLPDRSQDHYNKHLSIRTLKITPEEIMIEADCQTREALHLVKTECDNLDKLLRSASYNWANIAPIGFSGALPAFRLKSLRLCGREIPMDLAMARFRISQTKAFSLLQGKNIYSGQFPFARELLQNAIDSTKIQCYKDYTTSSKFRFEKSVAEGKDYAISGISQIIDPLEYPIKISMRCSLQKKNGDIEEADFAGLQNENDAEGKYGILFSIEDYGTGIDSSTIRDISDVGSSYKNRKKLLRGMPDWLRPTGEFGIGLQSVFLVNDKFSCETYVRNGERYRIEFLTGAKGEKGYINVNPKDPEGSPMPYGTKFEVFLSHEKRIRTSRLPDESRSASYRGNAEVLCRQDMFSGQYNETEIKRDIAALATQLLIDIDEQMGDLLFPVYAHVYFELENKGMIMDRLSNIILDVGYTDENYTEKNLQKHVCWMYKREPEDNSVIRIQFQNDFCLVDLYAMKIYMWLENKAAIVCVSMKHLLGDNSYRGNFRCPLFYKGVLVERYPLGADENFVEYIDVLGGRQGQKLIRLSRNGLTSEGRAYIKNDILPAYNHQLLKILKNLAVRSYHLKNGEACSFPDKVEENFLNALQNEDNAPGKPCAWQRQLLGISLFYNFYKGEISKEAAIYKSKALADEERQWEQALRRIIKLMDKYIDRKYPENRGLSGVFRAAKIYFELNERSFKIRGTKYITVADFYDQRNKFLVLSKRRTKEDKWVNALVLLCGSISEPEDSDDTKEPLPKLIELLEESYGKRDMDEKLRDKMESWGDFLLDSLDNEPFDVQDSDRVLWLMESAPVRACFMDAEGNHKIHVLSGNHDKGIYYNRNARYWLIQEMVERYQGCGGIRFAGNVWKGYEYLGIPQCPEEICEIKESYMRQNKMFMVFPCDGNAAIEIEAFVEDGELTDRKVPKSQNGEMVEVSLQKSKETLTELGDEIYRCLSIYDVRNMDKAFLINTAYGEYCKREKEVTGIQSFLRNLAMRYSNYLRWCWKNWKKKNKTHADAGMTIESFLAELDNLNHSMDHIKETGTMAYAEVLKNEKYLLNGDWVELQNHSEIREGVQTIFSYITAWRQLWEYLEELEMIGGFDGIIKKYWSDSSEKDNLILWVAAQTGADKKFVEERYEQFWLELKDMAVYRRRLRVRMKVYNHKLADWMERSGL